jgi:hypothetical protein
MQNDNYIWQDKKRNVFGLPWCFVRYKLSEAKLIIDSGLFTRVEDEVWLYRITDITLRSSFLNDCLASEPFTVVPQIRQTPNLT